MRVRSTLPWLLAVAWALSFLWLGGVSPAARAAVHLALAVVTLVVSNQHPDVLRHLGTPVRWLNVLGIVLVAGAAGLMPLPTLVLDAIGAHSTPRGSGWGIPSVDPEATVGWLAQGVALAAMFLAAAACGGRQRSGRILTRGVLLGTAAWAGTILAHDALGLDAALGLLSPRYAGTDAPLPLVNPNHAAALANLAAPAAWMALWTRPGAGIRPRLLPALVVAHLAAIQVRCASSAGIGIAVTIAVLCALPATGEAWRRWAVVAGVAALAGAAATAALWPAVWRFQWGGRLGIWGPSLAALADHPVFGVGAGAFAAGVDPYRLPGDARSVVFAHNDPLQGLVEMGLVGLAALAVAAFTLRGASSDPIRASKRSGAGALALGLAALGAHALVDFPLHIPAVGLAAAIAAGLLAGGFLPQRPADPTTVRHFARALAASQLVAAGWTARESVADRAEADVLAADPVAIDAALSTLALVAPWRPAVALGQLQAIRLAEPDPSRRLEAVRAALGDGPHPPAVQLAIGVVALDAGDRAAAREAFSQVTVATPWDWRPHVGLARTAPITDPDARLAHWADAGRRDAPPGLFAEAWQAVPLALAWERHLPSLSDNQAITLARTARAEGGDADADVLLATLATQRDLPAKYRYPAADAARRLGLTVLAETLLRSLVAEIPSDATAMRALAAQLTARGDRDEAVRLLVDRAATVADLRGDALAAVAARDGADAALTLLRRWRAAGTTGPDALRAEEAALHAARGDTEACHRALDDTIDAISDADRAARRASVCGDAP